MENIIISDLRDAEYAIWDCSDDNVYIYRDVNMNILSIILSIFIYFLYLDFCISINLFYLI